MRSFISGWIMVFLSICCVFVYIFGNKLWADIPNIIIGWWLFAAGFFIAGIFFIAQSFDKNQMTEETTN